ncbi:hypothetical protein MHYP_G00241150 [Metynnis hypsauchen]
MMINSANQNGDTPLQLAQRTNQRELISLLTHPPNPLTTPLGGVSQLWTGQSGLLRFSHTFSVMSLSVCASSTHILHSAVQLLTECVSDCTLTHTIKELCVVSRAGNGGSISTFSDEPQSRESPHGVVPYSTFSSSSDDDDGDDDDDHDDDDEELLIPINSGRSENQLNCVGSPALFSQSLETELRSRRGDEQHHSKHSSSPSSQWALLTHNTTDTEDTETASESKKSCDGEPTAEQEKDKQISSLDTEKEKCWTASVLHRRVGSNTNLQADQEQQSPEHLPGQVCETPHTERLPKDSGFSVSEFRSDSASVSWRNPQQLKPFNNCPILLYSSSQSSPALFVSHNNTETRRRRSNSEGCGHEVTVRKSWSLIGDSTSSLLTPSSAPAPLDYTAESWSALVDAEFLNTLDRGVVKRQEVIYELMQTEFHHVQTLMVMAGVLRRGLLEEVQLEEDVVGQIFPSLDDLITLHRNFLAAMETRRRRFSSAENCKNYKNYIIQRIGDVLLQQFCGCVGDQVMGLYGDFCSKHSDALRIYKQLQQNNRKLQLFIRISKVEPTPEQQSSNSVIKRREIPEFLLLITQRITKYPVLLERLLHCTDEGTVEQRDVAAALEGLRGVLAGVELHVSKVQRAQKLDDIIGRLDPKSCTRLKSGEIFSKHTLTHTTHTLTHSAVLTCRTTSGRLRGMDPENTGP